MWSSNPAHLGPGSQFHLGRLGCTLPAAGHPASANHRLPPPSPEANLMVEQYHRRLKDTLRACLPGLDWASSPSMGPYGSTASPHRGHRRISIRAWFWCSPFLFRARSWKQTSHRWLTSWPSYNRAILRPLFGPSPMRRWRPNPRQH